MSLSRGIKKLWAKLAEPEARRVLYHGLAHAPRLIVHVASIAALAGLVGACVPAARYEEAKSASEVELAQRQQKLAETEQSVSETKLENSVAVKERDEATGLVDQLRGELARVGDDLRTFAKQKADLEKSLDAAQARKAELEKSDARTVAIARLTRDLTSALGDRVTSGDVSVDVQSGRVVVSTPTELWFDEGAALRTGSDGMLAAVSRVLTLHPDSALEMSVPGPDADKRSTAFVAALGARGVSAARIKLASAPAASVSPVVPEATVAAKPA